ncbi:response regulator [Paenibacillus oryzisoli]|uniref:response regulator n=1 Tax=Paenibacillus oryzisoli TaxID=1850517 RepID=UPI003D2DA955
MKAILIDDERHALLQLQWMLEKEADIEIVGVYQQAAEGLSHLSRERVELVFLDLEMPGMGGLEAAETIAALDDEIRVVFVTAYSTYALEAFNVNALDYVLKPIDPSRFATTLERVRKSVARQARDRKEASPTSEQPAIELFGHLSIRGASNQPPLKWRTLKSKELFAYLLQHREVWLPKDVLLDEIWPSYELDKATSHLHTAIYQVRRMLKETGLGGALDFSLESYRLHGEGLRTDVDLFLQAADAASQGGLVEPEAAAAWELYRGHYLDKEDYPWAKARREELLQNYVVLTMRLTSAERAAGSLDTALRRVRRARELHPYSERLAREQLACLAAIGDAEGLRASYAAFCQLMTEEMGTPPTTEFQDYGQALIDGL